MVFDFLMLMTIFEKIIAREVPADIVHEDDDLIAFRDVDPKAPVLVLIVPKMVIPRIGSAETGHVTLLGKLLLAAQKVAEKTGVHRSGYRLVINHGEDAGETMPHLHVHLLGGRVLAWPPG